MNLYLVSLDLVSAIYIIVMIVGSFQAPREILDKTRPFIFCLLVCLMGCFVETGSNLLDGDAGKSSWIAIFGFLEIILVDIITLFYSMYVRALLEDKSFKYRIITIILSSLSVASLILNTVMYAAGRMFTVIDGELIEGSFFPYKTIISSIIFIGIFYIFVASREVFGFKNIWMTILFMVIPAATILIATIFAKQIRTAIFPSTATSLFVVYVVIQSKTIIQAEVDTQVLGRLSFYDPLTGLKNRRGYEEIINNLSEEEKVSVIFCDANGLKAVNDNLGHASGDEYIKKIANILCNAFPEGEVCRISGDEFVCILKGMNDDIFRKRTQNFESVLNNEGRIVAFGYESGSGNQILTLIKSAEKMMYSDKEKYYLETGKDRRR